ncbi:glycosyl hydrolase family 95 catalytic domain-containing protein [Micromonospora chokoriensis]|uniref:glycosyl hydrolase family 95 catalytic domain-containing protein n=1 Tax=Micromonospora chokoriensis TaxID=356851 RepID=UPI00068FB110|nr:glycoside hydrolase N-terminal domain-containing protein [Micromonospora chokoriensis]
MQQSPNDLVLAWPQPASSWFEAAPVGNGRLGAMVFGGIGRSQWQVNDATLWSGTPDGPAEGLADVIAGGAGPTRLAEVRQAILDEDYRRAETLITSFEGPYSQEYLPFVDLWMALVAGADATYGGRTLNLDTGVVDEAIDLGDGRRLTRRTWASRPARALCISVSVDGGTADLRLGLTSPLPVAHHGINESGIDLTIRVPVDGAPLHEANVAEPLRYAEPDAADEPLAVAVVRVDTDGVVTVDDGEWSVRGMTYAVVTLGSSTSSGAHWAGATPGSHRQQTQAAARDAESALATGADELLRAHEQDLGTLLASTRLTVGDRPSGTIDVATDILGDADEALVATVIFQLGRYLLASASRPGGPPANLQGIWNDQLRPPWSSNYTININTQMNYWGVEAAGLSECHHPLFHLIERLSQTGAAVSRDLYGARGWVAHHNTDLWGWALPVGMGRGAPSWAIWMMGGVWLTQHVWDHFDFTQDTDFLRDRGWPLLRGCAEFCLDWLVDVGTGWRETIPSTSPENSFISRAQTAEALSYSTAMDVALIRALFTKCLAAADILGLDDDPVCQEIRDALPRLRPTTLTQDGRLREWVDDHPEQDPLHRHMSQLVGLYPLDQISPEQTPELAAAAARVLDAKGPGAFGWPWAWKIALRARLADGETARDLLREATRPFGRDPLEPPAINPDPFDPTQWGGLLPNLLSSGPPFQIDGNYGLMAAILELVVQSHGGVIHALPAVPEAWPDGSLHGVHCRGGWIVDLAWRGGQLEWLTVRDRRGDQSRTARIRCGGQTVEVAVPKGQEVRFGPDLSEVES